MTISMTERLRVALLRTEYADVYGKDIVSMFNEWLSDASLEIGKQLEIVEFNAVRGPLPSLEEILGFDGVVIPGSLSSAYDGDEWISNLSELIRRMVRSRVRMVGVCFGHQIIARALGGSVVANPKGLHLRLSSFEPNLGAYPSGLFNTSGEEAEAVKLHFSHNDVVVSLPSPAEGLPEGVSVASLGGSPMCPVQGLCLSEEGEGGGRVFGVTLQGHPEYATPTGQGCLRGVIDAFCKDRAEVPKLMEEVGRPCSTQMLAVAAIRVLAGFCLEEPERGDSIKGKGKELVRDQSQQQEKGCVQSDGISVGGQQTGLQV
uniref:Glutamine amidotransferase domain-containing protein n=1 Tax=Chromera velia CCMP2878 TaxID=1169474 RepID=A0A0G4HYR3_9ALVE|eukprot:Cvel_33665.t1-p1 / transcript=Cvel_33665.t1 / gene=Cvel_33665 / organism=Chromera_velia_CCMP2878 / gene_product=Putative glutamine amidotransferase-like protein, putative / transcript_product=Putative glutamine amidotransferase-like protein, putative / location=Cvel_scaffold5534:1153-4158(-) / protein_length=316 / sequence_SO=supercontig / SO=protein_coding / is_pseudo=false